MLKVTRSPDLRLLWWVLNIIAVVCVAGCHPRPQSDREGTDHLSKAGPNPRANEIQTAFEFGVSQLVKDGISLARGDYRILLKPFVSGWEVEYSRSSGERGGSRVYAFPSNGGLSASAIQPSNSGIEEAFKLGVEELAKEGCPFRRGEYTISIEPNGMGWEMRYSETPRRVNGDRLLIIQNRYVRVAPL